MSKVKHSLHLPVAIHFPTVGDKGSHSLLETVSNQISGGDEILYKKVCLVPCFLFFSVLTARKLKNQKREIWERG